MNQHLLNLARHNFASIQSLAGLLKARGYWTAERSIEEDATLAVHDVFQAIAWSDRKLDHRECRLLDALLDEDALHGHHLKRVIAESARSADAEPGVPGTMAAAALHDALHQTQFRELMLNHLENIGMLIVMADGQTSPEEVANLRSHFLKLRKIGVALPNDLAC